MVQIKDRYGVIREGSWTEFWTEHNFIQMHGFQTKPSQSVAHSAEDRSLAAAQGRIAKAMGPGFMDGLFGSDKRPLEQRIASEVARQLAQQKPSTVALHSRQPQSNQNATTSIVTQARKFTLADAQKRLREAGVSWPGVTDRPGTQRTQVVSQSQGKQAQTVSHCAETVHGPIMFCQIARR